MRFKVVVASVLLLIGAYSFFWFQIADQAEKKTLEWISESESRLGGVKIFVGDVTVSGFPYKIAVEASSLNAIIPAGKIGSEPISVTVPEIAVVYQPWKPNHGIIFADYLDAVVGNLSNPGVSVTFDKVKSSVILDPDTMELNNLSVVAESISWYRGVEAEVDETSSMKDAEFHLRRSTGETLDQVSYDLPINRAIYFKAQNAVIKEFASTILGERADEFKLEAFLHGSEQPDYTKEGLSKWRDEGGTLSIRSFEYGTPETGLTLNGDVTLDENLKPLGAFDAKIANIEGLMRTLARNENIPQIARQLLLGQAQSSNSTEEFPVSISLQNGLLYLGPIMMMELPPIVE